MKSHALFDCIRCVSRIHHLQEIEDLCGLHCTVTVYGCKTLALLRSELFNFIVLKDTSMEATTYSFDLVFEATMCIRISGIQLLVKFWIER